MTVSTAAACAEAEPLLKQIWQEFRRQGITDDLTIIEHMSFLLLLKYTGKDKNLIREINDQLYKVGTSSRMMYIEDLKHALVDALKPISPDLIPLPPTSLPIGLLADMLASLDRLFDSITPAQLLNECLVFHLANMLAGGRYATPRHIAHTMTRLIDVQPGESILDPACGSGGLLVEVAELKPRITGIEISPNWARIAWTNTILHGLREPDIRIGNSFAVLRNLLESDRYVGWTLSPAFSDPQQDSKFDCVLLNPPFGETIERFTVQDVLGVDGGRSETLFSLLALRSLKRGGRMTVLVPTGTLFARSSSEDVLRRTLLDQYQLRAVVSLPKDSLQPYTGLQTHLLVIHNPPHHDSKESESVWFYRVNHDGYSNGRNRRPESEKNELPRIEAAVLSQMGFLPEVGGQSLIAAHDIRVEGKLTGYHLTRQGDGRIIVSSLNSIGHRIPSLLVTLDQPGNAVCTFLRDNTQYSGLKQTQSVGIAITKTSTVPGTYKLAHEGLEETQLILKGRKAWLEKRGKLLIEMKLRSSRDKDRPALLAIDLDGSPLAPLFTVNSVDQLPKSLQTSPAGAFLLEDEKGHAIGYLIVFSSSSLDVMMLAQADGQQFYLADLADTHLFFWPTKNNRFARVEVATSVTTFTGETFHQGVAVDVMGNWFGVQVPTIEIVLKHDAILQPSEYFPKESILPSLRSPAALLGDIKRKHQQLNRHIDYLLGIVELRSTATAQIPPAAAIGLEPFGTLNEIQQAVWEIIRAQVEQYIPASGNPYPTPRPFRVEEVRGTQPAADVLRALELFERMGLIVGITIDGAPYFRLVTPTDLVIPEAVA